MSKLGSKENPRHVIGLSGGKDSSALVIHMKRTRPEIFDKLEMYFTDTGTELEETYEYLDKLEKFLGKKILRLKSTTTEEKYAVVDGDDHSVPFDEILNEYNGYLPSPMARWCTRKLKIEPMEKWIGQDYCCSYIGIRADEPSREGYNSRSKNVNITGVYPYREDGLGITDVYNILEETVGLPEYYKWRTRSGCFFCFYQRRVEWAVLYHLYPELLEESIKYETEHEDGRSFTWVKDRPLEYIKNNSLDIIKRYVKKQHKKASDTYKEGFVLSLDEMLDLIEQKRIKEFIDTWDLKRLHDVTGENKEGCTVCVI